MRCQFSNLMNSYVFFVPMFNMHNFFVWKERVLLHLGVMDIDLLHWKINLLQLMTLVAMKIKTLL